MFKCFDHVLTLARVGSKQKRFERFINVPNHLCSHLADELSRHATYLLKTKIVYMSWNCVAR